MNLNAAVMAPLPQRFLLTLLFVFIPLLQHAAALQQILEACVSALVSEDLLNIGFVNQRSSSAFTGKPRPLPTKRFVSPGTMQRS
jgi:hypothetical protein